MKILWRVVVFVCTCVGALAHGEIPGAAQSKPIALTNATIHTGKRNVIERGTIVFDKGKIIALGTNVSIPATAQTIDCSGSIVYPGFIAPNSTLGLVEIEAVRATRDVAETGSINPNARAEVAYNPDSEIIPTVRSNGVLLANVVPQGGLISGTSSVLQLDGWTREDAGIKGSAALSINFPNLATFSAPWMRKSAEEQRKDNEKNVLELYDYFEKALMYAKAADAGLADNAKDIRMEAMRAAVTGKQPVMISCGEYKQILAAINFANHFKLRAILVGCEDAWRLTKEIKTSGYPLIINRVHSLPARDEEGYDTPYRLPSVLTQAGIPFAFSDGGSWQQRNLPFQAGTALAFGLSELDAVASLTIEPATMLGIDSMVGSLEVGKHATLFVSTGNALDALTNNVTHAWVQGKEVSLENRHTRLAKKYRTKLQQQGTKK